MPTPRPGESRTGQILRNDRRVRRGKMLLHATINPVGLIVGVAMAVLGLVIGVPLGWVIAAGLAAFGTAMAMKAFDPAVQRKLSLPQFSKDLRVLDDEHLGYMMTALNARDRFGAAASDLKGGELLSMQTRINYALEQVYDSVLWAQRAKQFLITVDADELRRRIASAPEEVAPELREQLKTVEEVAHQREETLARVATTSTGIETLAVKAGGLALDTGAPSDVAGSSTRDVGTMRQELNAYINGLEEVEKSLRQALPR